MNRNLALILVASAAAISTGRVAAQELLTNGGMELLFPDVGGRNSAPPGWTLEEGPLVPEQPGPYPGDYNNGGVGAGPCPATRLCGAVDAADYTVSRDHLGQAFALPNEGPGISTGNVTMSDYQYWKTHFGEPYTMDLAQPANFSHLVLEGDWHMWFEPYNGTNAGAEDNSAHLSQTVAGTPGLKYTMTGYALFENYFPGGVDNLNASVGGVPTGALFNDGAVSPTDAFLALEFLDSVGTVFSESVVIELKAAGQLSNSTWMQHTLSAVAPAGTTQVRVRASMLDGVLNPLPSPEVFQMSFFVDAFSLTAGPVGSGADVGTGAVPEPAATLLGAFALATLGGLRFRPYRAGL